jgi:hypothetical protein
MRTSSTFMTIRCPTWRRFATTVDTPSQGRVRAKVLGQVRLMSRVSLTTPALRGIDRRHASGAASAARRQLYLPGDLMSLQA